MNDLKFAFRQLLKSPGFTAVAVLTLAPVADFRQRRSRRGKHGISFSPSRKRNGRPVHQGENEFQPRGFKGGETEDVKKVVETSKEKTDPKKMKTSSKSSSKMILDG